MLEERRLAVLQAIVSDYVATHEPVGSKALVDRHHLGVSPATIRNDMAALEEEGYITAPHTSAGRIPTDLGYRMFVDQIAQIKPLSAAERKGIDRFLFDAVDLDDIMTRTVRLLAQLTKQVAIVQYPSLSRSQVRRIELIPLNEHRLMIILIVDSGRVEQRIVECAVSIDEILLADLRERLSVAIAGAWSSMFLLMEPWLQFTTLAIRGVRTWSVVSANMLRGVWVDRSAYPSFLADGGIGWGCEIDPRFCEEIRKFEESSGELFPIEELAQRTASSALLNPLSYLEDRFRFIAEGWFSSEGSMGASEITLGLIALIGIATFVVFSIQRTLNGEPIYLVLLAMLGLLLLPQMVGHVEPRYFIPLKLMVVVLAWAIPPTVARAQKL